MHCKDTQNWKRTSWDRQNESRTQYNNTQQNHPTSPMRVGHDAPPRAENSSVRWKSESNINSQMQNNNRFCTKITLIVHSLEYTCEVNRIENKGFAFD